MTGTAEQADPVGITLDIRIESKLWDQIDQLNEICQRAAGTIDTNGEIDVLLTDDEAMRMLNRDWRDKDRPTDVLSFPNYTPQGVSMPFLGDIAIGFEIMARDAASAEKSIEAHLSHLLIHGILHLQGHDHVEDADAQVMEALEIRALKQLGFENPYSQADA